MSIYFWPSLFLALGLLLILAEVFVPSGGMIGLCALACLGLSLWYAFDLSTMTGAWFLLIEVVVLPATIALAFSLWSRSPLARKMFLAPPSDEELGASHDEHRLEALVGQVGRAVTPLRPCGHLEVDGRRFDGLADDGFIPEGTLVRVIGIRTGQLLVRRGMDDFGDRLREHRDPRQTASNHNLEPPPGEPRTQAPGPPPDPSSASLADRTVSLLEDSP